ncbi:hypothetical protein K438DRAFT_1427195, partial [Mycena galopus ATCC 62051]
LLRLSHIISSTPSFIWAYDKYIFLGAWTNPQYRTQADELLPSWFKTWPPKGTRVLFTSFPMSLIAGIDNAYTNRARLQARCPSFLLARCLFRTAGTLFYGRVALRLLKAIRDGEPEGKTTKSMGDWLTIH